MSYGKVVGNKWTASERIYEVREWDRENGAWVNTGVFTNAPEGSARLVCGAGTSMSVSRAKALGLLEDKSQSKPENKAVETAEDKEAIALSLGITIKDGGWYELPNGDNVQGIDKAIAAAREADD